MAAEVISIFDRTLRKIRKELEGGPLPISYLCSKYGVTILLQLLETDENIDVNLSRQGDEIVKLRAKDEG